MNDKHEQKLLCSLFSCTLVDLEKAVDKAGREVEDIKDYFARNPVSHKEVTDHEDVELNIHNEKEIHYICTALGGCVPVEVTKAAKEVGPSVKALKSHFKR